MGFEARSETEEGLATTTNDNNQQAATTTKGEIGRGRECRMNTNKGKKKKE